jgi:hypothetical protein
LGRGNGSSFAERLLDYAPTSSSRRRTPPGPGIIGEMAIHFHLPHWLFWTIGIFGGVILVLLAIMFFLDGFRVYSE